MKRREFVQLAAASTLGTGLFGANRGLGAGPVDQLDRFGGWTGKQFGATGFFRTEHDGNRWWFVTPEGNAFISLGVNHYNRDHWIKRFGASRPLSTWTIGTVRSARDSSRCVVLESKPSHRNSIRGRAE